ARRARSATRKERQSMSERSSRSVQETRDKEAWLIHLLEGEAAAEKQEVGSLLAAASLVRATAERIEAPAGAEEESRQRALAELASLKERRRPELAPVRA